MKYEEQNVPVYYCIRPYEQGKTHARLIGRTLSPRQGPTGVLQLLASRRDLIISEQSGVPQRNAVDESKCSSSHPVCRMNGQNLSHECLSR
jgi:hypothetical protein